MGSGELTDTRTLLNCSLQPCFVSVPMTQRLGEGQPVQKRNPDSPRETSTTPGGPLKMTEELWVQRNTHISTKTH